MTDLPPPSAEDPEGAPPPPYPSTLSGPAPSYPPPGSYQQPPAYPPGPTSSRPATPRRTGGVGISRRAPRCRATRALAAGARRPLERPGQLPGPPGRMDHRLRHPVRRLLGDQGDLRHVAVARITINTNTATNGVIIHHHSDLSLLAGLLQIAIVLLYGALFCGSARGQTPGMMAVSVKAVDARTRGPIGFWRGLGRAAFEWVLWIVFILPWVLDMLFPLWDLKHQTLHDKVSGTVVIKALSAPPT